MYMGHTRLYNIDCLDLVTKRREKYMYLDLDTVLKFAYDSRYKILDIEDDVLSAEERKESILNFYQGGPIDG